MIHKVKGIVLHKTNYSESSQIVKIFTESHGTLSFIMYGIRSKSKSKKPALQALTLVDLVFKYKESNRLHTVSEFKISQFLPQIQSDNIKSTISLFVAELLYKTLREEEKEVELYHFLENSILLLENTTKNPANFPIFFLLYYTHCLGFFPQIKEKESANAIFNLSEGIIGHKNAINSKVASEIVSKKIREMRLIPIQNFYKFEVSNPERKEILDTMLCYYLEQKLLNKELFSPDILHQILA